MPPHMGGGQDDGLRLLIIKELPDGHGVEQVELTVGPADEMGVSTLEQIVPDGRAHESAMPGYIYFG